jgi:hypothetical protein
MNPFRDKASSYGEELLAPRPTSKLEDQPLPAVHDCLHNTFATTLHIGGGSSMRTDGHTYRGADKSSARPTSRCILFDAENILFDACNKTQSHSSQFCELA